MRLPLTEASQLPDHQDSPIGFHRLIQRLGKTAKMPFRIHPHMLRHACGYKLANDGHDTRSLQHYLSHKNIQHTVRYTASLSLRRSSHAPSGYVAVESACAAELLDHRIGKRKQLIRNIEADCFRGLVSNSSRPVSERLVELGSKGSKDVASHLCAVKGAAVSIAPLQAAGHRQSRRSRAVPI
jgi:hypothetical protein